MMHPAHSEDISAQDDNEFLDSMTPLSIEGIDDMDEGAVRVMNAMLIRRRKRRLVALITVASIAFGAAATYIFAVFHNVGAGGFYNGDESLDSTGQVGIYGKNEMKGKVHSDETPDVEGSYGGLSYRVLDEIAHDDSSFTQGLTYSDNVLYESTGLYGASKVRRLDPTTGDVLASVNMDRKYFGEGMAFYGDSKLIQITWKEKCGFIYNASTLERLEKFSYKTHTTEGWGITYIPERGELVVSDGSEWLHFWNDSTLEEIRRIQVRDVNDKVLKKVNELEYVNGRVLANIWYSDDIVSINPDTGAVIERYDFSTIWPENKRSRAANVFNGISISDTPGHIYVTGKKWSKIFLVSIKGLADVYEGV